MHLGFRVHVNAGVIRGRHPERRVNVTAFFTVDAEVPAIILPRRTHVVEKFRLAPVEVAKPGGIGSHQQVRNLAERAFGRRVHKLRYLQRSVQPGAIRVATIRHTHQKPGHPFAQGQ